MALIEAQVAAAEAERIDPLVPVLFDRDNRFYARVSKGEVEVVSRRDMRVPMEIRPGGNFGAFDPDGGDLGRGDSQSYEKALVPTVNMRIAIEWTTLVRWATDDKRKAVIDAFQRAVAKAMPEFRRQVDSSCMTAGDGVLGTITSVAVSAPNSTYTLTTDGFGARLLRYGQTINVYNSTLATRRTTGEGVKINLHDLVAKQVRVPTVAGEVAGDKLVVGNLTATPPTWLAGVPYTNSAASTGSWFSLDRATNPEIRANEVVAGTGFTLPFARLAVNKIGDRIGIDEDVNLEAWQHPCQVQAYEDYAQQVSIINKEAREQGVNLYFNDNMQMAGAPVKKSFSWDKTRIDFLSMKLWKRAEMHPPGFYRSSDGRRMFELRGSSGGVAAGDIFYIVASWNLYSPNPAGNAYVSSLTVPSGY